MCVCDYGKEASRMPTLRQRDQKKVHCARRSTWKSPIRSAKHSDGIGSKSVYCTYVKITEQDWSEFRCSHCARVKGKCLASEEKKSHLWCGTSHR